MDRIQSLLDSLISHHEQQVKMKEPWEKESYTLGRITGVRQALYLINNPTSTIPSDLI